MSKYSQTFKCTLAKQCLAGVSSIFLSNQYSISSRQIRYWAQVFAIHGMNSFTCKTQYSTAQAKLKALNLMWTNGWSLTHTSAVLNLSSPGILSVWFKRYRNQGIKGLETQLSGRRPMKQQPQRTPKSDDDMTVEELKEALAYLRAENAVLKKLEELALEKKRRQIKKKRQ